MLLTKLDRVSQTALRKAQPTTLRTIAPVRSVVTWAEQDQWEDPRGPLGVDRPSPKLAPLTKDSPAWLHDLHNKGVSMFSEEACERTPQSNRPSSGH